MMKETENNGIIGCTIQDMEPKRNSFSLTFLLVSAMIKLNEEDRGRSAHGWSSQKRVGFALPNRL